jgi:hypothetical protein
MAEQREESEGFYEMLWDCDHCGVKGLLGKSQRHCPECGAPQNPDKRYFPNEEQKKQVVGHVYEGSDAHCPSCQAPMGAKVKNCTQCGSPMDGSKEVREVVVPKLVTKRAFPWKIVVACVVGFIVICVAIWFFFFRTTTGEVTVKKHSWTTSTVVEQFADQRKQAWRNEVPGSASDERCEKKEHGSHQVEDGEECHTEKKDKKDGTFEQVKKCSKKYKSVPDYDDWCSFTVREWGEVDKLKSKGDGDKVEFPKTGLSPTTAATYGAKREGHKAESLTLEFTDGRSCDEDSAPDGENEKKWRGYKDGQKLEVKMRARSGDIMCDSLY